MITIIRIIALSVIVLCATNVVVAANPPTTAPVLYSGANDVLTVIGKLAGWIFAFTMVLSVIFILIAAFQYVTSGGGEGVEKATKTIQYAIIGIVVALIAASVPMIIGTLIEN